MSKRRDIEEHVRALGEIEGIMGAMKNLAQMESHQLSRVLPMQQRIVEEIEIAAQDFLTFHPNFTPDYSGRDLYLVIGAERGFCGDFNERLLSALHRHLHAMGDRDPVLVVVGRKLLQRAERVNRITAFVEGSTVVDEVPLVLMRVIEQLREVTARYRDGGRTAVTVIYHDAVTSDVIIRSIKPFQPPLSAVREQPYPPILSLAPDVFYGQLVDLYLFSLVHAIFYSALMAESRARLTHLESALQRLTRDRKDLLRKRNVLRQEEITEEIELLMLSRFAMPRRQ